MADTPSPDDENAFYESLLSIRRLFIGYPDNPYTPRPELERCLKNCINMFCLKNGFENDYRFLNVFTIYADITRDFENIFEKIEQKRFFQELPLLYESHAIFHIVNKDYKKAYQICDLGVKRGVSRVKKTFDLLEYERLKTNSDWKIEWNVVLPEVGVSRTDNIEVYYSPFDGECIDCLLNMPSVNAMFEDNTRIFQSKDVHPMEIIEQDTIHKLGKSEYYIEEVLGEGSFAKVYKVHRYDNSGDILALKVHNIENYSDECIIRWEYYMYSQLDKRIPKAKRSNFGCVHEMHKFHNCAILVCDCLLFGHLLSAVNAHLAFKVYPDELVCMYYTIEMLDMLETLHRVGLLHGDFKADNMLVRFARDKLTEEGFFSRSGPWKEQGLCLVDYGKGIDLNLFPQGAEFVGDAGTLDYRCIEMIQNKPWTYQADTYALLVNVNVLIHGEYMTYQKYRDQDGHCYYQTESTFQKEKFNNWQVEIWKNLFHKLLNINSNESDVQLLGELKNSFVGYFKRNPERIKELVVKLAEFKDIVIKAGNGQF